MIDDGVVATQRCTICLEELGDGVQITKLPCSHIYHNDCIVQWLKTSHLCPHAAIKYQLPNNILMYIEFFFFFLSFHDLRMFVRYV